MININYDDNYDDKNTKQKIYIFLLLNKSIWFVLNLLLLHNFIIFITYRVLHIAQRLIKLLNNNNLLLIIYIF